MTTSANHPGDVTWPATVKTHCPYCALQCGMTLTATPAGEHGESPGAEVAADDDFPVNRGQLCIKGFTSAALLGHPERLRSPLVRGRSGRFSEVSWEIALDHVAERFARIRRDHGPQAVGVFGSGALTNEKAYLLGKFARVALSSPNIDYNGRYCMSSAAAGQNRAFGVDRGLPFPLSDIARTQTLLLWGFNGADTMPPLMQWVVEQRDRGGSLIVVDPRRTETARLATLHLQPTPGTDLALANGLLHLAIAEGFIDEGYIEERTVGFDAVRRSVLAYRPEDVERLTGVPIDRQLRAARLLGKVESSILLSGRGPEQQSKGTDTVLALINLMLALGRVGKPFSGYGCVTGQGNGQGGREHGQKADQLPGYRLIDDPEDRRAIAAVWGIDAAELPTRGKSAYELIDSVGAEDGVRALLVMGSNVAVASPNAAHVERKLRALDLLVVSDPFENETTAAADVVLPSAQWAEEDGTMTNLEGRVLLRQRLRPPPRGVRTDIEILCELARRLGQKDRFSYSSTEDVFCELRRATAGAKADYSGITYDKIKAAQGIHWPCPAEDQPGTARLFGDRFYFADGRARFHTSNYRPAAELPDAEYPLFFTTGRYREHYNSGAQTRKVEALVRARPEARVQVHPRLALRLRVRDGDRLRVESRRGSVDFAVLVSAEIRSDTLFAPFHWGGRQAANLLTNPALDPVSRMPEFKVCAVRARAVVAADD